MISFIYNNISSLYREGKLHTMPKNPSRWKKNLSIVSTIEKYAKKLEILY